MTIYFIAEAGERGIKAIISWYYNISHNLHQNIYGSLGNKAC